MTTSKGRVVVGVVLVVLVALVASAAFSERGERVARAERNSFFEKKAPAPPQEEPPDNLPRLSEEEIRDVVNVLELWTLTDQLDLTDAQLASLMPKYRRLKTMRERFWQSRGERARALGELLKNTPPTPTAEQNAQLQAAFEAFQKENDTFWSEDRKAREEIFKELNPRQRVALLLWESESPRKTGRMLRALRRMGELRQEPRQESRERRPPNRDNSSPPPPNPR